MIYLIKLRQLTYTGCILKGLKNIQKYKNINENDSEYTWLNPIIS
jgi:hypothetical protein